MWVIKLRKERSISKQISRRLIAIAIFSMVLTGAVIAFIMHCAFDAQIKHDIRLYAKALASAYTQNDGRLSLPDFETEEVRITLLSPTGEVLFESSADTSKMENHLTRPEVRKALEEGEGEATRISGTLGRQTYYYALVLKDGNILRLSMWSARMLSAYRKLIPVTVFVLLVLLGISALLSMLMTKQLVRPITAMADDVEHMDENMPYTELAPLVEAVMEEQQRKEENETIRQQFTANVSHELKTPLTSISGYAEMIETGIAQKEDIPEFAGKIHHEAGRLITLISDIIKLSELDEPSNDRDFEEVDLSAVVEKSAGYLKFHAEQAGVRLVLTAPKCMVWGNEGMLEELVYNLMDNAIRYNHPGGDVRVSVQKEPDGAALLSVVDTGIGIPKEHQNRVFERFYRVDKSRSKESGGTGLGLAIVKHVAEQHGAKLSLESEWQQGTAITVRFEAHPECAL